MKYLVSKKENLSKIDRDGKIVETLAEALLAAKEYDTIFLYDDTYFTPSLKSTEENVIPILELSIMLIELYLTL